MCYLLTQWNVSYTSCPLSRLSRPWIKYFLFLSPNLEIGPCTVKCQAVSLWKCALHIVFVWQYIITGFCFVWQYIMAGCPLHLSSFTTQLYKLLFLEGFMAMFYCSLTASHTTLSCNLMKTSLSPYGQAFFPFCYNKARRNILLRVIQTQSDG